MSKRSPISALFAALFTAAAFAQVPPPVPNQFPDDAATLLNRDLMRAFLAPRRQVTLKEALEIADQKSPDLKAARAQADQNIAKTSRVYAALLPMVTLSGTYDYSSARQQLDLSPIATALSSAVGAAVRATGPAYGLSATANEGFVDSVVRSFAQSAQAGLPPTIIVDNNSLYGTLLIQQALFSPTFFLLPAAREGGEAARLGKLEAREQVLLGVAKLFLSIEGLEQLEGAAVDALSVAERREGEAKAQQRAGFSTQLPVLRAQSQAAQARATLATLVGQRMGALALLQATVGESIRPFEGARTTIALDPMVSEVAPWNRSFLVRSNELALASQRRFEVYDRLSWLPSLVGIAKGSYNSNRAFAGTNWIFDGIISLQWTLLDQGQRSTAQLENKAKSAEYLAQLESSRAKGQATWIGATSNLQAAQIALAESEAQLELATRGQRAVESSYAQGFSTNLEVSTADSQRFFAASGAANARAQLEIRKAELAAAEGRFTQVMGLVQK